jgi:phage FluMu protein Com
MSAQQQIRVQCLRCRHVGIVTESELRRRGIKPEAPIASFVKRLRCRKCGSQSVLARREPVRRTG